MNEYDVGDEPRVAVTFTDSGGTPVDPTTVTFEFTDPSGNKTTYVYDEDAELVRDDTGDYHVDVALDEAGVWFYRWESTGTNRMTAEEGELFVRTPGVN